MKLLETTKKALLERKLSICVIVNSREEWQTVVDIFKEAELPETGYKDELHYTGQSRVKFTQTIGYFWSSDVGEQFDISLDAFILMHTDKVEQKQKLPKVYDRQILKLAALIGVQDSLIEQIKENGNAIKALKQEMGIA